MKERPREAKIVQETLNQLTHQDNTTEARYIFFYYYYLNYYIKIETIF